jgi:ABC-type multidrug transport system ATPase subunit
MQAAFHASAGYDCPQILPINRLTLRLYCFFPYLGPPKSLYVAAVLTLQNISKRYGPVQALSNVSFEVPAGCVFGVLGPNGSGKTTLLGIVMDVLKPNSGNFLWLGQPAAPALRKKIGTLLETPNFYHYMSAQRNLEVAASIKGHGFNDIPAVLQTVGLYERRDSAFSTFSLGMKQRLAIGAALLGNPSILVFDEPTNGLDPVGIAEIRNLIKKLAAEGKTIIMASHLLDEVEKVCTHVAVLKKGNVLTAGPVNEVLTNEEIIEIGAADLAGLENLLRGLPEVKSITPQGSILQLLLSAPLDAAIVNQYCFDKGFVLNHLQLRRKSLESKFMEMTNNAGINS